MRTRTARYLKAKESQLYVGEVRLFDPMLSDGENPGPCVFGGPVKRARQWCRDSGYFFNSPHKV